MLGQDRGAEGNRDGKPFADQPVLLAGCEPAARPHPSQVSGREYRPRCEVARCSDAPAHAFAYGLLARADGLASSAQQDLRLANPADELGQVDRVGRELVVMEIGLVLVEREMLL